MLVEVAELDLPVDELPVGWRSLRLGDVARLGGGTTPSRNETGYWDGGVIPWATPSDITSLSPGVSTIGSTESMVSERALADCSLPLNPPGTVLMTSRATIGYAAINTVPMTTNQGFITFNAGRDLDPVFLLHWLISQRVTLVAAAGGSTFKELSRGTAKLLPIRLPPLDEQRRIAEVLRSLDEAIAAADAVARQWETAFAALLEAAFTEGEPSSLDALCSLIYRYPGFYGFDQLEEGVPVIRGEHLRAGRISTDWMDFYFVDPEFSARFPKTILQLNDVVMSVRGTVGTTAVVGASHVGSQISPNLIRLVANPARIMPPLLYYAVQSAVAHMRRTIVNAQALPAINAGDIKRVEIALPPLPEQIGLLEQLNGAAEATAQAVAALRQVRETKGMLMSDLLSGRVRVPA